MAKKKTRAENKFNDWYERVGKRLFDENNLKRSKKWMRTVYNDIKKEINPATGRNYTSEEAFLKIRRRREFMSESSLGIRNQIDMMNEQDSSFKRKIKGGYAISKDGDTYIRTKTGRYFRLYFEETGTGTPILNYEELLLPESPKRDNKGNIIETDEERAERIARDKKRREDFYNYIGGVGEFFKGEMINWW